MNHLSRFLCLTALALAVCACGPKKGGFITAIPSPDFVARSDVVVPELLLTEPSKPYTVVGIVDIRLTRQTHRHYIPSWLKGGGKQLGADAVIPPDANAKRQMQFESADPYAPFFMFDDGKTSIIQGRAIRYVAGGGN